MNQLIGTDIKIGGMGYLSTFMHPRLAGIVKAMFLLIVFAGSAEKGDWLYSDLNSYIWMTYIGKMTVPVLVLVIFDSLLIGVKGKMTVSEDSFVIERVGKPQMVLFFKDIEKANLRKDFGKLYNLQLDDSKIQVVLKADQRDNLLQLMEGNGVDVKRLNIVQKFIDDIK